MYLKQSGKKEQQGPSEHDLIENEEFQEDQKQTLTDEDTSDPENLLDTNDNHAPTTKAELVGSDTMIQLGRKQEMKKERNMDRKTDKGYSLQFSNDKPDTDINMTDQNDKDNQFKDQEQNTRKEDDFKVSLKKTKGPLAPKGDVTKMKDHYDPSAEEDLVESDSSLPPLKLRRNQHKKNDSKTGSKTGSRTDKGYSLQFSKDKPDTDITMTDQNEKDNQFKDQEQNTRKEDDFKASLEKTKGPLAPKGEVTKMKDHYDPSAEEDLVESDSSLPPLKLRRNQHKTNDSKTGSKTGSRTDKGYSLQFSKDKPDTDITMTDQNEKDNQLKDQEQNTRKEDDFKASLEKTKGPLAPKGDVTKMKDHDDPSAEEDLVESDSSLPPLKLRRNRHKKNDSKAGSKTGSRTDKGYSLQFSKDKPDTDITMTDQNEKDNQFKDQEQNYSITEGDTESETDTESYTYTSNEYFDKKAMSI
ncbi:uncharacterized protein DDB_G0283697-like [Mytilus californianus]|uniref:uncharacterized protein DDB_G0283697-like n=1 Tax=Mytilus californianus TaxID=6549 RepID=UPI00224829DF|nr:uncharacterized protein DDB_G0283697-like [Mytilus californianus]